MPAPSSRRCRAALASTAWSIATTGSSTSGRRATSGGASHPGCGGGGAGREREGPSFPYRGGGSDGHPHRDRGAAAREQPHQGAPAALQHHPAGRQELSVDPPRGADLLSPLRLSPRIAARAGPVLRTLLERRSGASDHRAHHKLFRVRQCTDAFFRNRSRPCLQYQIDRCSGPCVGLVGRAGYAEDVRHATMFLEGRSETMIEELVERMEAASRRLDFELAARYRDQISGLRRVQERQYVDGARGDIDVVAVCRGEGVGVVQIMEIRNGRNLGSHSRLPRNLQGATEEDILEAFLAQYYLSADRFIPRRIVLDRPLEGLEPLVEEVSRRSAARSRSAWGSGGTGRIGWRWRGRTPRSPSTSGSPTSRPWTTPRRSRRSPRAPRAARPHRVLRRKPYGRGGDRGLLRGVRAGRAGQVRLPALQHPRRDPGGRLRGDAPGACPPLRLRWPGRGRDRGRPPPGPPLDRRWPRPARSRPRRSGGAGPDGGRDGRRRQGTGSQAGLRVGVPPGARVRPQAARGLSGAALRSADPG